MLKRNRVVITQPTYLPWLGYFDLMARADTFIFFDHVQFEKRSWQQRNRIKTSDGVAWLTVPVLSKGRYDQAIYEVEIEDQTWQRKHLNTIKHSYSRAPFYNELHGLLSDVYSLSWNRLVDLNLAIIRKIAVELGLSPLFYRSSELAGGGRKAELLINLCREVGATHYLSGPAARNYLGEGHLFIQYGIELEYHEYQHPEYPQLHGSFVSHLSVIDAVMNTGWEGTRSFIHQREANNLEG